MNAKTGGQVPGVQTCRNLQDLESLFDNQLNMSQQYALEAKRANCILGVVRHSETYWWKGLSSWCILTSSAVCNFTFLNVRRI